MSDSGPRHTMLVVTSDGTDVFDWARVRRDSAERGEVLSLVVVDGGRALVIVPPSTAESAPRHIIVPRPTVAAEPTAWHAVLDVVATAEAHLGPIDETVVHLHGTLSSVDALEDVVGSAGTSRIRVESVGAGGVEVAAPREPKATSAPESKAPFPLRLVKVSRHGVTIVEVPREGGRGIEYAPWNPDKVWDAQLEWRGESGLRIAVGPYHLEAERADAGVLHYRGSESGPDGDVPFDVFVTVASRADLVGGASRGFLTLTPPEYEQLWSPDDHSKLGLRPAGRRVLRDPRVHRGELPAKCGQDKRWLTDQFMRLHGIGEAPDVAVEVRTFPTRRKPTVPLRYVNGEMSESGVFQRYPYGSQTLDIRELPGGAQFGLNADIWMRLRTSFD